MGIDASLLRNELQRSVEPLCSRALLELRGYSTLLKMMIARGAVPGRVIIVLHPVQFQCDRIWDSWLEILRVGPSARASVNWVLDYARRKWLDRIFYQPLPGN